MEEVSRALASVGSAMQRIPIWVYMSSPHMSGLERQYVADAFATDWIAPVGPHVDAFEREFCAAAGAGHAVAVSSGTAALHLALRLVGVGPGDELLVSTFTFAASVNQILYLGATPVLIDSESASWNMDPALLAESLQKRARWTAAQGGVVVHIYGQSADMDAIMAVCREHDVAVVEDATEALGATYKASRPGTIGTVGAFSFNGNKILTTPGGGMLGLRERAARLPCARA
jgi:dTDP-4-amino-4,6-dideoxygalactose transaminase